MLELDTYISRDDTLEDLTKHGGSGIKSFSKNHHNQSTIFAKDGESGHKSFSSKRRSVLYNNRFAPTTME